MIRRDYILRWTQELAKVIAGLLGKPPELQMEIMDETYTALLDLDLTTLEALPLEAVLNYLCVEKQFDEGQLEFLAEMLYRHGQLLQESTQFYAGRRRLQEALLIFEFLDTQQSTFSFERQDRMNTIRQAIDKK